MQSQLPSNRREELRSDKTESKEWFQDSAKIIGRGKKKKKKVALKKGRINTFCLKFQEVDQKGSQLPSGLKSWHLPILSLKDNPQFNRPGNFLAP